MDRREVIRRATSKLVESRELTSILNRTGSVRVAVMPDHVSFDDPTRPPDEMDTAFVVEFREMEHGTGRRLVAIYEGRSEFVA